MKKLISILSGLTIVLTPVSSLVACNITNVDNDKESITDIELDTKDSVLTVVKDADSIKIYQQKMVDALNASEKWTKSSAVILNVDVNVKFFSDKIATHEITKPADFNVGFVYVVFYNLNNERFAGEKSNVFQIKTCYLKATDQMYADALAEKDIQQKPDLHINKLSNSISADEVKKYLAQNYIPKISFDYYDTSDFSKNNVNFNLNTSKSKFVENDILQVNVDYNKASSVKQFTLKISSDVATDGDYASAVWSTLGGEQPMVLRDTDDDGFITKTEIQDYLNTAISKITQSEIEKQLPNLNITDFSAQKISLNTTEVKDKYPTNTTISISVKYGSSVCNNDAKLSLKDRLITDSEVADDVENYFEENKNDKIKLVIKDYDGILATDVQKIVDDNKPSLEQLNFKCVDFAKPFDKSKIKLTIIAPKDSYKIDDVIKFNVAYDSATSAKQLELKVTGDYDVIMYNELHENVDKKTIDVAEDATQQQVMDDIAQHVNLLKNKDAFKIDEVQNYTKIANANLGYIQFSVRDVKKNKLINNDADGNTLFKANLSSTTQKEYAQLRDKMVANQKAGATDDKMISMSLQNMPISSIVPGFIANSLTNPDAQAAVKQIFADFKISDFVNDFLNPEGKYGKLLGTELPKVDENGDIPADSPVLNFSHSIATDLQAAYPGVDITKGAGSGHQETILGGYKTKIDYDIYNLLKNVSPDLVHFHNYLIETNKDNKNVNNVLEFIKYLMLPVTTSFNNDDFSTHINKGISGIKTNLDNLIHDFIEPFSYDENKSNITNMFIVNVSDYGVHQANWGWFEKDDFAKILLSDPYSAIFGKTPDDGIDMNNIHYKTTLIISKLGSHNIDIDTAVNLQALHELEIKNYIKSALVMNNDKFNDATLKFDSGHVLIQDFNIDKKQWETAKTLDQLANASDLRIKLKMDKLNVTSPNYADEGAFGIDDFSFYVNF